MFIWPVGTGSLLVTRFAQWVYTPRVLRLGLAQSLLAERLRRATRGRPYYCPPPAEPRNYGPSEPATVRSSSPKPVDRFWPSEREDQELKIVVERAEPERIQLVAGTILDLWV